jgi:hypothetical protein
LGLVAIFCLTHKIPFRFSEHNCSNKARRSRSVTSYRYLLPLPEIRCILPDIVMLTVRLSRRS